jgi:hypothetical protein
LQTADPDAALTQLAMDMDAEAEMFTAFGFKSDDTDQTLLAINISAAITELKDGVIADTTAILDAR